MENTFTVRADECLSSNDPNVTVIPLKAKISGQLQRLLVLNEKSTHVKPVICSYLSWKKGENIRGFMQNLSIQTCSMFQTDSCWQVHVCVCVCVWRVLVMYVCERPISIIAHQRGG